MEFDLHYKIQMKFDLHGEIWMKIRLKPLNLMKYYLSVFCLEFSNETQISEI